MEREAMEFDVVIVGAGLRGWLRQSGYANWPKKKAGM